MGEYVEDPSWVDVIITTALTCQQREREIHRRATNNVSGGDGNATIQDKKCSDRGYFTV